MSKYLIVEPEKCTGCRICELVCSLFHSGEFNPALARITAVVFHDQLRFTPVTCWHCENPPCRSACPTGAISANEHGAVSVDYSRCIGCRLCVMACPFGAIQPARHGVAGGAAPGGTREYGPVVKCDLCGGAPECVEHCPTGAIEYVDERRSVAGKRIKTAGALTSSAGPGSMPASGDKAGSEG